MLFFLELGFKDCNLKKSNMREIINYDQFALDIKKTVIYTEKISSEISTNNLIYVYEILNELNYCMKLLLTEYST